MDSQTVPAGSQPAAHSLSKAKLAGISALLLVGVVLAYLPVAGNQFINFDDLGYIIQNRQIRHGLTWPTVAWAFTTFYGANWHPLTWLSHALDCQLYGLAPAGHHVSSLLFHALNTVLLFIALHQLTGATIRSAMVAALFGLHPLHVESVAWVAERKDVLSAFFFMLTLLAYSAYVRRLERHSPDQIEAGTKSRGAAWSFYSLCLICFALGLLSKPMLVTVPCVLLLLDYWPLRRRERGASWLRLVAEKIPFFVLSAAASAVTVVAQQQSQAVASTMIVPVGHRILNAMISYACYLEKMVCPSGLAMYYPYREELPPWMWLSACVVLGLLSAFCIGCARKHSYLLMGWLWFLGMLIPVIGLVQVGIQSMADRYSYLPLIGIFIALVWGVSDLAAWNGHSNRLRTNLALGSVAIAILAACAVLTNAQVRLWKDSERLYKHTLSVTSDNAIVRGLLGNVLIEQGRYAEGEQMLESALAIKPGYAEAESNLGFAQAMQGRLDEAITHYKHALELKPAMERTEFVLGQALLAKGKRDEAIQHYRASLAINPDWPATLNDLAWILATDPDPAVRNGAEAVQLGERACRITEFENPLFIGTLAAAYAEAGRFDEAVRMAERAREVALAQGKQQIADRNAQLLEEYRAKKPHREPGP